MAALVDHLVEHEREVAEAVAIAKRALREHLD
jgi:hypothetical protein